MPTNVDAAGPHWSPDGSKLLFGTPVSDQGFASGRNASSRRRAWIGGVTALTIAACAGETTSALTPRASSTASSHGAPTPLHGLPTHGRIAFSLVFGTGDPCDIMTIEPDGTLPRMLTNVAAGAGCYGDPTWTPTGDRILFDGATNNSGDHLFSISAVGGSMRQLLFGSAFDADPAISPDGTRIAFDRGGPNPPTPGIFLMNVDGSHVTRVTTPPAAAAGGDAFPSFSPDGSKLAFVRYGSSDGTEGAIYVVGVDGKGLRKVTPAAFLDAARPHWSPDGSKLLFGTPGSPVGIGGDRNVYVVNVDGSDLIELTHMVGNDFAENPAWSPDGSMIVFDRYVDGSHYVSLVVMRADGSLPTVIWHPTPKLDVSPRVPAWGTAP